MNCPNCNAEMISTDKYELSFAEWDFDAYTQYLVKTTYKCKSCKIKYKDYEEEWEIPKELSPTERQMKCVKYICSNLGMKPPVPTKKSFTTFIKENLNKSIARSAAYREELYEDYSDMFEPYY